MRLPPTCTVPVRIGTQRHPCGEPLVHGECRLHRRRMLRWLGRCAQDVHDGVIAGFDKLWYG